MNYESNDLRELPDWKSDDVCGDAMTTLLHGKSTLHITDLFDEGFCIDALRAVIHAGRDDATPAAQAKACVELREMWRQLNWPKIEAQMLRDLEAQREESERDAREYAAECRRDAA